MKIQHRCPTCNKVAETVTESKIYGTLSLRTYKCGHSESVQGVAPIETDTLDITSLDGKKLFPYQLEGARFIEQANGRAGLFDEMGLGKTIQFIAYIKAHQRRAMAFVKAGLATQWNKEGVRWGDLMCQIISEGSSACFIPGMDLYIVSQDSAWRIGYRNPTKAEKGDGKTDPIKIGPNIAEMIQKLKIDTVGIDECQRVKNIQSKRTKAIMDACRDVKEVIAMSGTPIENNAAEFFPTLNILRPDKYPNYNQFVYGVCDSYFNGYATKTGGLKNPRQFREDTKDFIIRRLRKDVLPDLPSVWRKWEFVELGEMVEDEYKRTVRQFQEEYEGMDGGGFQGQQSIIAFLSRMRHLTGLCKVDPVCNHVEQFILETDRKIVIFVHHKDVADTIHFKLTKMSDEFRAEWGEEILHFKAGMDPMPLIEKFKSDKCRVMVASELASAEGLNLQFCSDCIFVERQWNPSKEEQAESRFPRPGQTADKINATYFIATGTVDEFFTDIVEHKREIVGKTLDGKAVAWNETSVIRELAQTLFERGGAKWGF